MKAEGYARMRIGCLGLIVVSSSILFVGSARAQCVNTVTPTCSVYEACFAKYCPCKGDSDYFLSYGKRYCEAFLGAANFSDSGRKWRDRTLNCLQEAIVPKLDISENPSCNCSEMRSLAFSSHVACYTQTGASICDLGLSDLNEIRRIVDTGDVLSIDGMKQTKAVADICKTTAPDDGRRTLWATLATVLPN